MRCYRLIPAGYDPLSTEGAVRFGGRFNSRGHPMLYLAGSRAVAVLESRVHSTALDHLLRTLHIIEVAEELVLRPEALGVALPGNWNELPPPVSTRAFGDAWLSSKKSLGLWVPSVPAGFGGGPEEGGRDENVLINPHHPLFHKEVQVVGGHPFRFDARVFGDG